MDIRHEATASLIDALAEALEAKKNGSEPDHGKVKAALTATVEETVNDSLGKWGNLTKSHNFKEAILEVVARSTNIR